MALRVHNSSTLFAVRYERKGYDTAAVGVNSCTCLVYPTSYKGRSKNVSIFFATPFVVVENPDISAMQFWVRAVPNQAKKITIRDFWACQKVTTRDISALRAGPNGGKKNEKKTKKKLTDIRFSYKTAGSILTRKKNEKKRNKMKKPCRTFTRCNFSE